MGRRCRFYNEKVLSDLAQAALSRVRLVVCAFFVFAMPTSFAEDLVAVYQAALKNDPQFRAARAEYAANLETKDQSVATLLPTISAAAHYTQTDDKTQGGSQYQYDTNGYSLSLVQPIYRHENFVGLSQADQRVEQARATFNSAKQNLILRVATQYFAVLAAEDDLEFANAEKKSIKEQLIQTQQRFNVGLIAITDVHEAQARYDQSVARTIVAENTVAISKETMREITGTYHATYSGLSIKLPLATPDPMDISEWVNTALSSNTVLKASQSAVDIALSERDRTHAGHYPTLDLNANYNYNDIGGGALGARKRDETTLSLQLNVPLYSGGIVNSKTRAAEHRVSQAREQLEQTRRETERQTRNSYLSVIANISQVKALRQSLASSQIALEATQAGFEVGTRTAVDVLDSQRELYRSRRDYAQVRYNYVLETLKLKQAAGILSENDLKQLNNWITVKGYEN